MRQPHAASAILTSMVLPGPWYRVAVAVIAGGKGVTLFSAEVRSKAMANPESIAVYKGAQKPLLTSLLGAPAAPPDAIRSPEKLTFVLSKTRATRIYCVMFKSWEPTGNSHRPWCKFR